MTMLRALPLDDFADSPVAEAIAGSLARLVGAALAAGSLALLVALATWSVSDPSLSYAAASPIENWMGWPGSVVADLMMQTVGLAAPLVVALPLAVSVRLLRRRPPLLHWPRFAHAILAIVAASGALALLPVSGHWPLPTGLGGVLGDGLVAVTAAPLGAASGLLAFASFALFAALSAFCVFRTLLPRPRHRLASRAVGNEGFQIRRVEPDAMTTTSGRRHKSPSRPETYEAEEVEEDEGGSFFSALAGWLAHWMLSTRARFKRRFGSDAAPAAPGPKLRTGSRLRDALLNVAESDEDDLQVANYEAEEPAPRRRSRVEPRFDLGAWSDEVEGAVEDVRAAAGEGAGHDHDDDERDDDPFAGFDGDPFDDDPFADPADEREAGVAAYSAKRAPAPEPRQRRSESEPQSAPATTTRVTPPAAPAKAGKRIIREAQPSLLSNSGEYEHPPLNLLAAPPAGRRDTSMTPEALEQNARILEGVLDDFGVRGEIINVRPGPVVTLYELEPAPGIKSSRVIGLADDIARSMSAVSARVAVISGKNAIGIELPNERRDTVFLRELLASADYERSKARLALALGKTIGGESVITDLSRMPHLLVAGTTGSGKSVSVNTMILSLLYRMTPEQCRLIMIDPKMLELSVYDGVPHLLTPVVTDPKKAVVALKWAVREMEERYRKMAKLGVRNIDGYNNRLAEAQKKGEVLTRVVQTGFDRESGEAIFEEETLEFDPMPYIVIIVDEMADLMMVAGKDIEGAIQRLAQMARAAGLHLIMATQRPSVDVITGTIKANFPTRISFQVTSKIDSRTILGEMGAEQLLGQGDMLYMAGGGRIQRVHGPFVSDEEVEEIVAHLKAQGVPDYLDQVTEEDGETASDSGSGGIDNLSESDDIYDKAVAIVLRDRKASTSYIQRRLSIGYNRAASIIERMENEGLVGPANHAGKREILVPDHEGAEA
ncbi:FtsK/SpoIIIE family DNA translocase [Amorphus orientalis]|uniref:DNA translocase FtsK n=1 Tax=Amorphus orientalis TaxID=649198 RepID=A0AAE3VRY5_9HYPH|nr:DNA translocase FtsK 4TM domain-containing protein [Amorphus orientalis]MDQ0317041.1 S-DNA-T family DNA segregation ATPase FtsK/SpoIIIE [Amorphus orientalis]